MHPIASSSVTISMGTTVSWVIPLGQQALVDHSRSPSVYSILVGVHPWSMSLTHCLALAHPCHTGCNPWSWSGSWSRVTLILSSTFQGKTRSLSQTQVDTAKAVCLNPWISFNPHLDTTITIGIWGTTSLHQSLRNATAALHPSTTATQATFTISQPPGPHGPDTDFSFIPHSDTDRPTS